MWHLVQVNLSYMAWENYSVLISVEGMFAEIHLFEFSELLLQQMWYFVLQGKVELVSALLRDILYDSQNITDRRNMPLWSP